jgi:hypothetical protein
MSNQKISFIPDLRIQCDWDYSFSNPSSFWISYQELNEKSIYCDVLVKENSEVEVSNNNFKILEYSKNVHFYFTKG